MRQSKIQYNPALTVKENAKRNGVSEAAIRYYIRTNDLDRRFDRKQNIIADCRKYLKKHPTATKAELTVKLGFSQSTLRKYWDSINSQNELTDFDRQKAEKRKNKIDSILNSIPVEEIKEYLSNKYNITFDAPGQQSLDLKNQIDDILAQEQNNTETIDRTQPQIPKITKADLYKEEPERYNASQMLCYAFRRKEDLRKTKKIPFGNMCSGFPFKIAGIPFPSSENAYICGMFSDASEKHLLIQNELVSESNGYAAKKTIRKHNEGWARKDWYEFNVEWMLYCVWEKVQGNKQFQKLLLSVPENAIIIENSTYQKKDANDTASFWGCRNADLKAFSSLVKEYVSTLELGDNKAAEDREIDKYLYKCCNYGVFEGNNVMGKILMLIKQALHEGTEPEINYELLRSKNIFLLGKKMEFDGKQRIDPEKVKIEKLSPSALIGCPCGDIVGSVYEFHNTLDYNFEFLTKKSTFTDDTCLTACLCEWLLHDAKHTKEYLAERLVYYATHYKINCYGRGFKGWANDPNREIGRVANTNGCLMRVSPVSWFANSVEEAENLAEISASITHNHPDAIAGSRAIAGSIFLARDGQGKEEILEYLAGVYGYSFNETCDELRGTTAWTENCNVTVKYAIRAFLESWDFESAIRLAVSLGGDSDTIAAVTGSIAEAYYGVPDEIRVKIAEILEKEPYIVKVLNEFSIKYKTI